MVSQSAVLYFESIPSFEEHRSFDQRRNRVIYYGPKELAESFRTVRKNTMTIAQEIPEEKYGFRPATTTRSVGELLAHISLAYSFQYQVHAQEHRSSLEGFDFPPLMQRLLAEEKIQRSKDQVLEMLRSSGEKWAGWLEGLTESFLAERVEMRQGMIPPSKSRFEMILSVKEHEMHHRGQLMLIERMVGIVPHLTREMQARMAAAEKS
ncbi:MAG: DinB family protein [Terriglobia bacterium]